MSSTIRAVRGATQVDADNAELIAEATTELVNAMLVDNGLDAEDVISVLFTVTCDLTSAYPATSARLGPLAEVPMICATEIAVPDGLPRVIRAMAHVTVAKPARHVYLRGAAALRPDLVPR
jgi:chorismate mutase